jgi:hypothetical protein
MPYGIRVIRNGLTKRGYGLSAVRWICGAFFSGLDLVVSGAYLGLQLCPVGFKFPHTRLPAVFALG